MNQFAKRRHLRTDHKTFPGLPSHSFSLFLALSQCSSDSTVLCGFFCSGLLHLSLGFCSGLLELIRHDATVLPPYQAVCPVLDFFEGVAWENLVRLAGGGAHPVTPPT
jgi:hypothetical protein